MKPLALALALLTLASCGTSTEPVAPPPPPPPPSATTGSLAVSVGGLPAGTLAAITVRDASGSSRAVTTTQTLTSLTPGSYTVAATQVVAAGTTFVPATPSQTIAVVAGQTAAVTVSYGSQAVAPGNLTVTVSGLPASTEADIILTDAAGVPTTLNGSRQLSNLAPGSYSIAAQDVTAGGTTFVASPAVQVITVVANQTASATVRYALPVTPTGSISVTVTGLPAGVDADIDITNATGLDIAVARSRSISGILPGAYTIIAASVTQGVSSFVPAAPSQQITVVAGQTAQVTVAYAPAAASTGGLRLTVTGLPAGVDSRILVEGPNNFSHQSSAPETLSALLPGSYVVTALATAGSGESFHPTTVTQSATVTAGATASVTVDYDLDVAPATGELVVQVDGLADPRTSNVNVTQIGGALSIVVPGGTTSLDVPPGAYNVAANPIVVGGTTFSASSINQRVTLAPGESKLVRVRYQAPAASTGTIRVTLQGLGATSGAVLLEGPNGISELLTGSTTLNGMPPGAYTFTASAVAGASGSLVPSPGSGNLTVAPGATTDLNVTYSPAAVSPSLEVNATGLPAGVAPRNLIVFGPGGFRKTVKLIPTLFTGLAPGAYTIAAGSESSTFTFSPSAVTTNVTLSAAQATPVRRTIAYTATSGAIQVTGTAPAGVSPNIVFNTTTTPVQRLSASSYGLIANVVPGHWLARGVPVPPEFVAADEFDNFYVRAGSISIVRKDYVRAGKLAIAVTGLAPNVAADITIDTPTALNLHVTSSTTLTGLTPGAYTITASNTVAGTVPWSYAPTTNTQTIQVTSGSTVPVTVGYAPVSGAIGVQVLGVPATRSAAVTVTGPGRFTKSVPTSQTVADLLPGTYTITAQNIVVAGVTLIPDMKTQTVNVSPATTVGRTVTYKASGRLVVNPTGLPAGANPQLQLLGPNGFSRTFTGSISADLLPGTYGVGGPKYDHAHSEHYQPTAATTTVVVTSGGTATISLPFERVFEVRVHVAHEWATLANTDLRFNGVDATCSAFGSISWSAFVCSLFTATVKPGSTLVIEPRWGAFAWGFMEAAPPPGWTGMSAYLVPVAGACREGQNAGRTCVLTNIQSDKAVYVADIR